jgi:hypothetical protein
MAHVKWAGNRLADKDADTATLRWGVAIHGSDLAPKQFRGTFLMHKPTFNMGLRSIAEKPVCE